MAYTFTQLAPNWDNLTNAEKEALFENTNYNQATIAELQTLGKFKVLTLSDSASGSASVVKVHGIHNDFLVLPKELFGTNFNNIKQMNITENVSDTTNAKIRYVLTKDLIDYYTFNNGTWEKLNTVDADTVISNGMSADDLALISSTDWNNFYDNENGIGIAFAFHETALTQSTELDNLQMTVDMKGTWNKAVHTQDYEYGYSNTKLHVNLLKNGSYKINYGISSGGGSTDIVFATDEDIDSLFD